MSYLDILCAIHHNVMMQHKVYRHRITQAGQVSIPSEIRQRWGTTLVAIQDDGDSIVVRPLEEDLAGRMRGAWKGLGDGRPSAEMLREIRNQENEVEVRKWTHP